MALIDLLEQHPTKHNVFISYYHEDDEVYRNYFSSNFGHMFTNKSVKYGDIDDDLSDDYIKRLIQTDYISSSSVIVVLVGSNTKRRKHVDWEISAGLNSKVGGHSAIVAILLPSITLSADNTFQYSDLPERLADNVKSGYSGGYTWDVACRSYESIFNIIHGAFESKNSKTHMIDNSRLQMKYNQ